MSNIVLPFIYQSVKIDLPDSLDWREKGAVSEVLDQQKCGSCYGFSAIGSIESQIYIKSRKYFQLSVQQILDCDERSEACNGGFMGNTFQYLKIAGGIETEKTYPYVSGENPEIIYKCKFNKSNSVASVIGFVHLPKGNEELIREVVSKIGPVPVALCVSDNFDSYSNGIFNDTLPVHKELNHAGLIVGYGNDELTGTPYWLIKNSFGKEWGEKGYFRIERNVNSCYVADYAVYPIVTINI